jgi:hypothetical protein
MKRILEADLANAPKNSVVNQERLLLVLVPMKIAGVRKTLDIVDEKGDIPDYLSVYQYVLGSADEKLGLEGCLQVLIENHEPFQTHPDCIADADMTSLPLLLMFTKEHTSPIKRLPKAITHTGEEAWTTAKREDLGKWKNDITDGDNTYTFAKGPYKAVHFIAYDPVVVDLAIKEEKLDEEVV